MDRGYSIEARSELIYDRRSADYFEEVVRGYQQGNYRSATVMLWSVVVCDLLFKLRHMVDMYGDQIAQGILDDVAAIQQREQDSPRWEAVLLDKVQERTQLLERAEFENLQHLQAQRHLAAHPIISRDLQLHSPNHETVRALIRNALDGLLTKPPLYTRKIEEELIRDLSESAETLIDDRRLRQYLESKYFRHMSSDVEEHVIRTLWKFVFRLDNEEAARNREINCRSLEILLQRNERRLQALIQKEPEYYSNIASSGEPTRCLVRTLSKRRGLYSEMTDASKAIIDHTVEMDTESRCLGWFAHPDLDSHAQALINWIESDQHPTLDPDTLKRLADLDDSAEWESIFRKIVSSYYGASYSFDGADQRFRIAVRPYLGRYDAESLTHLLQKIEANSQTYERRQGHFDHRVVADRCLEVFGPDYDLTAHENFSGNLLARDQDPPPT